MAVWGDTLLGCVHPASAVRYRELQNSLDVAMVEETHQEAAGIAASLVKTLQVMIFTVRAYAYPPCPLPRCKTRKIAPHKRK